MTTGTPPFPRTNAGRGRQGAAATSRQGQRGRPPRPMLGPAQDGAEATSKEATPAASSTGRVAGAAMPRSRMPAEWSAVQARCAAQQQEEQRVAAEAKLKAAGRRWGQRLSCGTRPWKGQSGRGGRGSDNSKPGPWRVLSSQGSRQTGRQGQAGQRGGAARNGKVAVLADGDEVVPEPGKEVKVASAELLEAATESGGVALPLSATGDMVAAVYNAMASADEQDHVQLQAMMDSVVKVFCVHTEPNFSLPWQRLRQCSSTSSGFAVECNGRRCLLTNAHSVEYYSQVKVKRRGDDRKFGAKVLSVGTECDIAMLEVEDEEFWHGLDPLELGPLPRLQQQVAVIGYPVGGETISVTTGVVSRIEVTPYVHGSTELLGVQIDAAINSGNSGGPVFTEDGQCCGIAFQSLAGLGDAENIGYVIPTPIIEHFLADYQRNGSFTGFPSIGIEWQAMDSQALRAHYNMTQGQKGVLVRRVNTIAPSAKVLKADDVVMEFDGVQVASDGTVPFGTGERIAFSYLISEKFTGDKVKLRILRGSEEQLVEVELSRPPPMVPAHINNEDPSYFVVSGLVFTPCTERYLESEYNSVWEAPVTLQYSIHNLRPKQQGEQVVLLSQVLATAETVGYEDYNNMRVHRFNGQDVSNLKQLARLVVGCEEQFLHFELDYNRVLVLENKSAKASTAEVLRLHNIPRSMSRDIEEHLEAQPPLQERPRRRVPPEQDESGKMAVAASGTDSANSATASADAISATGGAGDALVVGAAADVGSPSSDTAVGGAGSSSSSSGQK